MLAGKTVGVVGGGVAGLTFAICAAQRGAQVEVFEQAPELAEVGAGVQISSNAARVINSLECPDPVVGTIVDHVTIREMTSGRRLMRQKLSSTDVSESDAYMLMHRADLIGWLANAACSKGVELHLGQCQDARWHGLRGTIGDREFDHVVRASGVKTGEKARFSGRVAWRALAPGGSLNETQVFIGPGRHLVAYPLRNGDLTNLVGVQDGQTWAASGWNHPAEVADFQDAFMPHCQEVRQLLWQVSDVIRWGLFVHDDVNMLASDGPPQIGDAAQTMLPFMAQGAAMAMEDAWSLAATLDGATTLFDWAHRRSQRRRRVMQTAEQNGRIFHEARPLVLPFHRAGMWGLGKLWPGLGTTRLRWLYDYDVVADFP